LFKFWEHFTTFRRINCIIVKHFVLRNLVPMLPFVNKPESRNLRFLSRIFFSLLVFMLLNSYCASAAIYDWLGATSTDVTVASNWSNETTHAGGVPSSGDDVYIGVNSTYQYYSGSLRTGNINLTTMPVVTANTTWKSLTFGYNVKTLTSYAYGTGYGCWLPQLQYLEL